MDLRHLAPGSKLIHFPARQQPGLVFLVNILNREWARVSKDQGMVGLGLGFLAQLQDLMIYTPAFWDNCQEYISRQNEALADLRKIGKSLKDGQIPFFMMWDLVDQIRKENENGSG